MGSRRRPFFNAFPIFKDLEQHPDFKQSFPFNDIGYLSGAELAQIYKQWDSGQLTDQAAVSWIAAKVADAPYTLGNPPQDMNRDGQITHRDNYLRDYPRVLQMQPGHSQSSPEQDVPAQELNPAQQQGQPQSFINQIFDRMYEAAVNKDDKAMDAALDDYAKSPQGQQFQREIDMEEKLWLAQERTTQLETQVAEQQQQIEQQQQMARSGPVLSR